MNLLVVSTWFPYPPNNGSKIRAFFLLRELAGRHAVTLLSFAEPGEEQHAAVLGEFCQSVHTVAGNPTKVSVRKLSSLFGTVPRSYREAFDPRMQELVQTHVARCDAAVALQIASSVYLRERLPVPRLLDELEVSILQEPIRRATRPLHRLRRQLTWLKLANFARRLVSEFDHTTVVSDLERQCLVDLGCDANRLSVVPNAVDGADLDRPRPEVVADRLIYPGSLTYGPNFDAVHWFLAEVLPLIHRTNPRTRLVVTGSVQGVDLEQLPNRAHVDLTGHVTDIKSLVAESAACIVPLRIGGGTRLKILEAMALGTPVIATTKGAEGLDVTTGRDILVADMSADFASAVVHVLESSALADSLRQNARARIGRQYTWQHAGALLCERIAELAQPAHVHRAR